MHKSFIRLECRSYEKAAESCVLIIHSFDDLGESSSSCRDDMIMYCHVHRHLVKDAVLTLEYLCVSLHLISTPLGVWEPQNMDRAAARANYSLGVNALPWKMM